MSIDNDSPRILAFISDLMFATRIESVAERLGFQVEWVERGDQIAPPDPHAPARQLGEHLVGPGAELMRRLTRDRPALILFDLGNSHVPWREWVALIKSVPATRHIPVVCYGSHVNTGDLAEARARGADAVLARSRFASDLQNILQKYSLIPEFDAIDTACQEALSSLAVEGLEAFNRGEYFEAHELLEEAWNEDDSPARELYRAILQVAVAYLQIERGNFKGAAKMFLRLRQWIDPLPDVCRGVNVAKLRAEANGIHQQLLDLGPYRLAELDRSLFQPVEYRREK